MEEKRECEKMRFYRTGEVVTDIGIIAFKSFLEEMKLKYNVDLSIKLENNYLEISKIENFSNIYTNFIWEKLKEKSDQQKEKEKEKEGENKEIFLPYLRNSGKFGKNSGSEKTAKENFEKLIDVVILLITGNIDEVKEKYKLEDKCTVCRNHITTGQDINNKERKISKYTYSFLGRERNTFSNYGKENIRVCFMCEFLYLNFLIFVNMGNYNILFTENLKELEFFNYKMNLFRDFTEIGFYKKMIEYNKRDFKIYRMNTDPNKGIIIKLVNILDFKKLIEHLKSMYIIEKFNIKTGDKSNLKKQIEMNNIGYVKEFLLSNIFVSEGYLQKIENIQLFLKFLTIGGKIMEEKNYDVFFTCGQVLSQEIGLDSEGKKSSQERVAFKLIKLMQSDNRARILEEIMHLLVVNKVKIPFKFSEVIMKSDRDNMHYALGRFIEGLMNNKK